jgi:hypothetical protein
VHVVAMPALGTGDIKFRWHKFISLLVSFRGAKRRGILPERSLTFVRDDRLKPSQRIP